MHNTPRDFFLHFGAFVALYAAAIALATLLFRMIDYAFPDPLYNSYYYSDPYAGPMRFAIASLIILVPLFLYLMRVIQREARREPERYSLTIRKWLTYVTLFVAGATIVGDLITLLYSFLGGELATPFLLKVLTLLVIVGAIFWYFLLDIRGYWREKEKTSKAVGWGVLLLVVAVVIGGFYIMGSPRVQREIQLDQQQIQDLSAMQGQIVSYWQQNQRLPIAISELQSSVTGYYVPNAPEGREAYEYKKIDDLNFSLCATFERSGDDRHIADIPYMYGYGISGTFGWEHQAGRICFTRMIDINLIQPYTKQGQPIPSSVQPTAVQPID